MAETGRQLSNEVICPDEELGLLLRSALGSGLIDQSQKMTVAARAMADMKVWAQRS